MKPKGAIKVSYRIYSSKFSFSFLERIYTNKVRQIAEVWTWPSQKQQNPHWRAMHHENVPPPKNRNTFFSALVVACFSILYEPEDPSFFNTTHHNFAVKIKEKM